MLNSPEYVWDTLEVGEDVPSPRAGHSLCYNGEQKQLILFGGASHEDGLNNDTFLFDLTTKSWEKVKLPAHCPSPRYEHACISLPGEMLIMFGAQAKGLSS
jgi:Galactose oxidase, central domain